MNLKSYGHATLSFEKEGKSLFITDPWLIGSCYWRSWWLQHYPSDLDLSILSNTDFVFLTHEHWDHTHFPTLKRYFLNKKILIPKFNSKRLRDSLRKNFQVEEITPNKWFSINEVNYMSIPMYNDDSILLFQYKNYLVCNINDSKPTPQILNKIKEFKKNKKLKMILMQSYAPASINNSFIEKNSKRIILKSKVDYAKYVMKISKKLEASYFVPFASQAVFSRPDSEWANNFKSSWSDLNHYWNINTKLLKSYINFDFHKEEYGTYVSKFIKSEKMNDLAKLKYENNQNIKFNENDLNYFSYIASSVRYLLFIIYPFGIKFNLSNNYYNYSFLKKKFLKLKNKPKSYLEMPVNEFIESNKNFQFTDLGTSFVMKIHVNSKLNIVQTYLLFIFLTFSEKGYFSNYKNLLKQISLIWKNFFPKKIF